MMTKLQVQIETDLVNMAIFKACAVLLGIVFWGWATDLFIVAIHW